MTTEITTTKSFQEKMFEKIRESMGDLMTEDEMIIIHNISKEYSTTDWQKYEIKVNEELICEFDHKASNGLAECLRAAGDAVEDKKNIDMEEK